MNGRPSTRYPLPLRILHWGLALLLMLQLTLGFAAEYWTTRKTADVLLALHFRLGMLILGLMLLRLTLRLASSVPPAAEHMSRWRRGLQGSAHSLLYLLVLALPLSGHVIWVWMGADRTLFAGIQVPALFVPPDDETGRALAWYVHVYGAWLLSGLVVLHVVAAWHESLQEHAFVARRMGFGRSGLDQSETK